MELDPYHDGPDIFDLGGIEFENDPGISATATSGDFNAAGDRVVIEPNVPQINEQPPAQQLPSLEADAPQAAQPPEQLVFAGRVLHATHKMAHKRGIIWCTRCGVWSTSAPRGLREPCNGIPTRAGLGVIRRVRRGLTPIPRLADWPLPADGAPPPRRWHS